MKMHFTKMSVLGEIKHIFLDGFAKSQRQEDTIEADKYFVNNQILLLHSDPD